MLFFQQLEIGLTTLVGIGLIVCGTILLVGGLGAILRFVHASIFRKHRPHATANLKPTPPK